MRYIKTRPSQLGELITIITYKRTPEVYRLNTYYQNYTSSCTRPLKFKIRGALMFIKVYYYDIKQPPHLRR